MTAGGRVSSIRWIPERLLVISNEFQLCFKWHILAFAGDKKVFCTIEQGWQNPGLKGHNPVEFSGLPGRRLFPTCLGETRFLPWKTETQLNRSPGGLGSGTAAAKCMVHKSRRRLDAHVHSCTNHWRPQQTALILISDHVPPRLSDCQRSTSKAALERQKNPYSKQTDRTGNTLIL